MVEIHKVTEPQFSGSGSQCRLAAPGTYYTTQWINERGWMNKVRNGSRDSLNRTSKLAFLPGSRGLQVRRSSLTDLPSFKQLSSNLR